MSPADHHFSFGSDENCVICSHCLQYTGRLKTDKRGKPYVVCGNCQSRSFLGSDRALSAIRMLSREFLERLMSLAGQSADAAKVPAESGVEVGHGRAAA